MIAPTRYWPWPPMLNIPQRNAKRDGEPGEDERDEVDQRLLEVERGGRLDVVDVPREPDVRVRERDRISYEPTSVNQFSPAPSKIAL